MQISSKKVYIETLGCQMNKSDTERILAILSAFNFEETKNEKEAENHGKILGSVHFLAPEVLQGKPFSVASDIYAAGITFFQLVTGILPFDGSTKEVADAQVKREFPRPSNFVTSIPKEFDELVFKAVDKNPKNRYKSAEEFKSAINLFLLGKKQKKSLLKRFF